MKYLKSYNESIKHLLKPKKEEDIIKNAKKLTPLKKFIMGVEYGILWLIEESVKEGIDPSYHSNLAIQLASENGHIDIVKYLLKDNRVDPSSDSNLALDRAYHNNHIDIVKLLLKDNRVRNKLLKYELEDYENYINDINESIKHLLKPKSDENILKELEKLSDSDKIIMIIKYQLPYNLLPDKLIIDDSLYIGNTDIIKLPDNLTVEGNLDCSGNELIKLPDNLTVYGNLDCSNNKLTKLPNNLKIGGSLYCYINQLIELPENLNIINGNLFCHINKLIKLPDNLTVNGSLWCYQNELVKLPNNLMVNGELICSHNLLTELPDNLTVGGKLECTYNKLSKDTKKPKGVNGNMNI